ncbi:MAG: SRPBCC domain-containing protein [Betaproteobacteria bacterium]
MDSIHQEMTIDAAQNRVHAALTDAREFAAWTGAPATIDPIPGGAFSCFGGMIEGRVLESSPQRIVQAWRVANWPAGRYSIVTFAILGEGASTRLILDHAAFPDEERAHLEGGWGKMYLEPLKRHLQT